MKVYIVSVQSESSDHYGPYIFMNRPTDVKLEAFLRERCGDEFSSDNDGPGFCGSFLDVEIKEIETE